jgi:hypothetical protein
VGRRAIAYWLQLGIMLGGGARDNFNLDRHRGFQAILREIIKDNPQLNFQFLPANSKKKSICTHKYQIQDLTNPSLEDTFPHPLLTRLLSEFVHLVLAPFAPFTPLILPPLILSFNVGLV